MCCPSSAPAPKPGALRGKKVGEEPGLLFQFAGARVVGEELAELIFEHAGTTGFEEDKRKTGVDLRRHAIEDLGQVAARCAEKAEVVEWAAATDVALWDLNPEACAA